MLTGILPALTTPFDERLEPSAARLRENIERYERLQLGGYLILGSTGEAVLLDDADRQMLLEAARACIPSHKPMLVGVPAESTAHAIRQACAAGDAGADAVLVSTPHYYRGGMTPEALERHLGAVAGASPLPVYLYNVPKFTGIVLPPEVVVRMSRHHNVYGLKESSGEIDYLRGILASVDAGFEVLCGAASILRPALDAGACGGVLAIASAFPEPWIRLAAEALPPQPTEILSDATTVVLARHGVAGIKAAMDLRGLHGGPVRGPLLDASREARAEIEQASARLVASGLLPALQL